jgi:hypothetical protein
MRLASFTIVVVLALLSAEHAGAQPKRSNQKTRGATPPAVKAPEIGNTAVVLDETLSVLRARPSLFSEPIQRMRLGRKVQILGTADADGVKFYKVAAPPNNFGWVQADAVFGKFRHSDEERLIRIIQAADGFEQIELASEFLKLYPESKFRPAILLLYGDLLEEAALKLSRDANSRLTRKHMAASAAPLHSFFLNFVSLDRYRKLGVVFQFNPATRSFHYDGASWKEIWNKFASAPEAADARKRLDALTEKMARTAAASSSR